MFVSFLSFEGVKVYLIHKGRCQKKYGNFPILGLGNPVFLTNAQRKTHRTATESVLWAESAIVVGSLPRKSIGRDV